MDLDEVLILDGIRHSLGLEVAGGRFQRIFPQFTPFPATKTMIFTTFSDSAQSRIFIYEGEDEKCRRNSLLGVFVLKRFPVAPRGVPRIVVTFSLDANGILSISAEDSFSNISLRVEDENRFWYRFLQGNLDLFPFPARIDLPLLPPAPIRADSWSSIDGVTQHG